MGNHNANSLEMNGFVCAQQLILLLFANFTVLKFTLKKLCLYFHGIFKRFVPSNVLHIFQTDSNG